ncbi:MAG: hypothetical protein R3242_07285 [Akkermansiaceae bacterium]|nr:hypothetical protein [Akkermansiaceae bacterium]
MLVGADMKLFIPALLAITALNSCQTTVQEDPPHQSISLNYTMLGIWPERHEVYGITEALKQAGINYQLSGYRPCIINVEAERLEEARAIANASQDSSPADH